MSMDVQLFPEASAELLQAITYYEGELAGLGQRFWHEFGVHVQWILLNHDTPRLREGDYRRVNLKVFPYYIPYIIRGDMVWILAVAHNHKLPEYWIARR